MKIAELVSALEELGTIYRHASKSEPKPCIVQVLALLKGSEHLQVSELRAAASGRKPAGPKVPKAAPKPSKFVQEVHLNRLLDTKTEAAFEAALDEIKRAKPTNDNLTSLLAAYTGIPVKKGRKKEDLYNALDRAFKAELRQEARAEISRNILPI